jgi:hypothetical protein
MKILVFAPFANVWDHSLVEFGIANALAQSGSEITVIGCKGLLAPQCISSLEANIDFRSSGDREFEKLCSKCVQRKNLLRSNFENSNYIDMDSFISTEETDAIQSLITKIEYDSWINFEFMNLQIGRIAFYEFALKHKLRSTNFPRTLWPEYLHQVSNSMKTALAFDKILSKIEADRVIVHNALYSVNRVVALTSESKGVPCFSIGASQNFSERKSSFTLFASAENSIGLSRSQEWASFSELKDESSVDFDKCDSHFKEIMSGSNAFTYSQGAINVSDEDTRKFFDIQKDQRVCVATLSSEDEFFAANILGVIPPPFSNSTYFSSQFEWIEFLFSFFRENSHIELILRVHPREFPNKRDSVTAENVEKLRSLFNSAPKNVHINWPEDNLSVYQIAGITDLLLNWTSTVGVEFLSLGIPVLIPDCSNLFSYPYELNHVATSKEDYGNAILELVNNKWSKENITNAFKWITFLSNEVSIGTPSTNRVSSKVLNKRPTTPGVKLTIWNRMVKIYLKDSPLVFEKISLKKWELSIENLNVIFNSLLSRSNNLASLKLSQYEDLKLTHYSSLQKQNEDLKIAASLWSRLTLMYKDPECSHIWGLFKSKF